MADIRKPMLLYFKAGLLLFTGVMGAAILIVQNPDLRFAAVLAVTVWAFCRAYYFAFYVIEHYIDAGFRFAGLFAFTRYVWSRRHRGTRQTEVPPPG